MIPLSEEIIARFRLRLMRRGECLEWTGARGKNGYGNVAGRSRRTLYAHRLAYLIEHGAIPPGVRVCHRCDNRLCCNPAHLFLGTAAVNSRDMVSKDRQSSGEHRPLSKLNRALVEEARRQKEAGATASALARRFGVSVSTMCRALRGETWRARNA